MSSNHGVPKDAQSANDLFAKLKDHMDSRGLRSTGQRQAIIEAFLAANRHVSIEELLQLVRAQDPGIGYATVYRTLKLLAESGLAHERQFGDGLTRYELADDEGHHDHLICLACGAIQEFENEAIERAQEKIARGHGYELRSHKLELYGICPACQ